MLFTCYVLFDFAYDIQTLYSVVIPIILTILLDTLSDLLNKIDCDSATKPELKTWGGGNDKDEPNPLRNA